MNTWLDHWDRRYIDRVRLLVEILPVLAQEPRFALKGGTAINLFEHDLPRLSVDIDLAWLPVHDYAEDAKLIAEALGRLADLLRARPLRLQVQTSAGEGAGTVTRLVASRGRARVQIETTPVMRGTVHPVRRMVVRPRVEAGVDPWGEIGRLKLTICQLLPTLCSRQHGSTCTSYPGSRSTMRQRPIPTTPMRSTVPARSCGRVISIRRRRCERLSRHWTTSGTGTSGGCWISAATTFD